MKNECKYNKNIHGVHASHTNFRLETCIFQHDSLLDKAFSEPNTHGEEKRSEKKNKTVKSHM